MKIPFVFKKCGKCGRWLVANTVNFHKNKTGKYGLNSWCKECYSVYIKKYMKKYNREHKEEIIKYMKKYNEENKAKYKEYYKKYNKENKEAIAKQTKKYRKTPQGQVVMFNIQGRRRQREEQQGNGITKDQWLEMMKFFDFKCAYSGITLNADTRSIDHIVPLAKGGAHEVWNCVPMYKNLNKSKKDSNIEEWYPQQDFYDEDKLNKINEWREYAYNKWSNKVNTKAI